MATSPLAVNGIAAILKPLRLRSLPKGQERSKG